MKFVALVWVLLSVAPIPSVRSFVHDYLAGRSGPISAGSRLTIATLPNGIVLAYVFGRAWCGATGGCTLLILQRRASSYRVIGARLAVELPIYVLDASKQGEPNLGLIRAGSGRAFMGGLWYPEEIIWFDGRSYGDVGRRADRDVPLGKREGRAALSYGVDKRKFETYPLSEPL